MNQIDHKSAAANRPHKWAAALNCLLLLAVAVAMRGWQLDHVPGVNGDEAWMGVQAQRFLDSSFAREDATAVSEAVQWQTPTGNPLNWLLFWPTVLLHAWLPPSIGLLRLPALLSGVLALGVNYWLCGRVLGKRLAAISTVLLAVLPINIAYSRFGWDACQSLLVTLPVMYLSLLAVNQPRQRRVWLLWAAAAQAVALLVHPTNVFAGPLLLVAAGWCYWSEIRTLALRTWDSRFAPLVFSGAGLSIAAAVWLLWPWCVIVVNRLMTPGEADTFGTRWLDLFSGLTVYQFIPGSLTEEAKPVVVAYRVATRLTVALLLWGVFCRCREERSLTLNVLMGGSLASLVGFFLIAGPEAIRPHFERYGICLIASGTLVLAVGAEWWLSRREASWPRAARLAPHVVVPAVAWLLLVGFGVFYLAHFQRTGGQSHLAFRTAAVEPKLAALSQVVHEASSSDRDMLIVADDWWNYWPLAYLAHGQEHVTVWRADKPSRVKLPEQPPRRDDVVWIGFRDSETRSRWLARCRVSGLDVEEWRCNDYADRAVVSILRARPQHDATPGF